MEHEPPIWSPTEQSLDDYLESLPGVAYVVDQRGLIVAYGQTTWDRFARENGGARLTRPEAVLGRSVFDAIADEDNLLVYRGYHKLLFNGARTRIAFHYRCDTYACGRDMLMTMTTISADPGATCVLYLSRLLEQIAAQGLLFPLKTAPHGQLPLLRVCSYCQYVRAEDDAEADIWMTPTEYVRAAGSDAVRLTHGICPACYAAVVRPQLKVDLAADPPATPPARLPNDRDVR